MANSADRPNTSDTAQSGTQQHGLGIPRPPSVGGISSRATDIASEDGDRTQSFTSPPPSSVSRRNPPPTRNSMAASSQGRPGSSGSRLSRSHIPSLTAQAFFRPMSSQRLQAHRGGRPMTKGTVSSTDEWADNTNHNRRSLISNSTLPQGSAPPTEVEAPPSRGTEFTDPVIPDRNTSNASPMGNTTIRSLGESVRLLRDRDQKDKPRPSHLNLSANYNGHTAQDAPPKSPLSFLSLQNKGSAQNSHDARGHERLSSTGSSPQPVDVKREQVPRGNSGKNWEYFTGNTLFCAGGRLQNSRDKPINIATGVLVVVPAALFFGFSYDPLFQHAFLSRANHSHQGSMAMAQYLTCHPHSLRIRVLYLSLLVHPRFFGRPRCK